MIWLALGLVVLALGVFLAPLISWKVSEWKLKRERRELVIALQEFYIGQAMSVTPTSDSYEFVIVEAPGVHKLLGVDDLADALAELKGA